MLLFNNFYYIRYTYLTHDQTLIAFPIWNFTRIYLFFNLKTGGIKPRVSELVYHNPNPNPNRNAYIVLNNGVYQHPPFYSQDELYFPYVQSDTCFSMI